MDELAKIRERRAKRKRYPVDLGRAGRMADKDDRIVELELVAEMAAKRLEELGDQEIAPIVRGCLNPEEGTPE